MHYSISPEEIKVEIEELGHMLSNIWNITDSEHQKAKDYSTQQHGSLNNAKKNDSIQTFLRGSLQQTPRIILCGR
jgi:hypothetical protein